MGQGPCHGEDGDVSETQSVTVLQREIADPFNLLPFLWRHQGEKLCGVPGHGVVVSTGCAEESRQPSPAPGPATAAGVILTVRLGFRCGHFDAALLFWASNDGSTYTADPQ